MNEIIKNIESRRAVKPEKFSDRPVPEDKFRQILQSANWAPTHAYTEPWRFYIFSGESRKKLAQFEADYYRNKTKTDSFVQSKYDKAFNRPLKASYILAIVMERQLSGRKVIPEIEEIAATACAVQNMMLHANSLQIDTYWGSGGSTFSQKLKDFLALKEEDKCMGFLYFGYRNEDPIPKGRRLSEIEDKVKWM